MSDFDTLHSPSFEIESEPPDRRRTVLIWVIFAYACFVVLFTIYAVVIYLLGWEPQSVQNTDLPDSIKELNRPEITQMDGIQIIFLLASTSLFFAASLALFNLRAKAIRLFLFTLLINVAGQIYFLLKLKLAGIELSSLFLGSMWGGILFSLAIYGLILFYALRLRRKGVLI